MKTIKDIIGNHKGRSGLVICAGSSVRDYKDRIYDFMRRNNTVTIGINNVVDLYSPEYHLWTNTKRFRDYGDKIKYTTNLMIGQNISIKLVREVLKMARYTKEYTLVNYTDQDGIPIGYKNGKIYGHYRTAGCLAIMILHMMGITDLNIVGMDGHTLHDYDKIKSGEINHHCYDEDYVPFPNDVCVAKDELIVKILTSLQDFGIRFNILTPTVYEQFSKVRFS